MGKIGFETMMKAVFFADHAFEAHLVRGRLEAEGIAAQVRGEWLAGACGELPASGLVTVWVADADVPLAEEVLAQAVEFDEPDVDPSEDAAEEDAPEAGAPRGQDRGVLEA